MPIENPYASPRARSESPAANQASDIRAVRGILYFHVLAIVFVAILALRETGQLHLPELVSELMYGVAIPLMFTVWLCPIAMSIAIYRLEGRSPMFRFLTLVADVFLSLFQLWVMLPFVQ